MKNCLAALVPAHDDDYSLWLSISGLCELADEVLVWDDCSGDQTRDVLEILRSLHPNLRTYRGAKRLGWVESRNRLLSLSSARYLLLVDADDVVCEWRLDAFRALMRCGRPLVQLGLVEAWGDFAHGTGRGWKRPHHDPCHLFVDRRDSGPLKWENNRGSARLCCGVKPHLQEVVTFCHAKGVKSDERLAARPAFNAACAAAMWRSSNANDDPSTHARAVDRLLHDAVDPLRRVPPGVRLPEVCRRAERFEVVYRHGQPIDRLDHGWELESLDPPCGPLQGAIPWM